MSEFQQEFNSFKCYLNSTGTAVQEVPNIGFRFIYKFS